MRWLVLALVAANIGLFVWLSGSGQGNIRTVQEGRLPRVAEIQLIDQQGENPEQSDLGTSRSLSAKMADHQAASQLPARQFVDGSDESRSCFGVGWFEEQEDANEYLQRVESERPGLSFVGQTEQSEPLEDFHWVLIPPFPTREDAMARYRELVEDGVEAYVVPSGERENAISLGLFRSLRSAEDILQRRQAENISAILVKFPRNRIRYALVFEGSADPAILDRGAASEKDEAELQLIEFSACEGVATTEKNP